MNKKVESMLAGLEGDQVSIDNIDQFFQKQGVIVRVHVGRIRGNFELTPSMYGVRFLSDEVKDFFKEHSKNGFMSFIPMRLSKEFQKIENRIRMAKSRMSIGYENSFMPIDVYKEYAEQVQKAKEEYFEIRDNVVDEWDDLRKNFEQSLNSTLGSLNPEEQEGLRKAIMSRYPSKKAYQDSFYMRTSLKAFPVMANLSLLDEDLSEDVKEAAVVDNLDMVHEVLGVAFNETFQIANTVYKSLGKNRKLPNKTKGALSNAIKSIKAKNLLKHPSIHELIENLDEMYHLTDTDESIELAENILAKSYGESTELGLNGYVDTKDCELDESDLDIMYQAYIGYTA